MVLVTRGQQQGLEAGSTSPVSRRCLCPYHCAKGKRGWGRAGNGRGGSAHPCVVVLLVVPELTVLVRDCVRRMRRVLAREPRGLA